MDFDTRFSSQLGRHLVPILKDLKDRDHEFHNDNRPVTLLPALRSKISTIGRSALVFFFIRFLIRRLRLRLTKILEHAKNITQAGSQLRIFSFTESWLPQHLLPSTRVHVSRATEHDTSNKRHHITAHITGHSGVRFDLNSG